MVTQLPEGAELGFVFARLDGALLSEETVASALSLVTSLAVETVPSACGAGVTLTDADGRRTTAAATDAVVQEADALQYALEEGVCLDAWSTRSVHRVDDLESEIRWPRWSRSASALGLRSALSAPLVAGDLAVGAVKVYSREAEAFGSREERLLSLFGAQAAVLVANKRAHDQAGRLSDQMRTCLRQRDVLNQAKGVIMHRDGTTDEAAFSHLVSLAQRERRTVHEAAVRVVEAAARRRR